MNIYLIYRKNRKGRVIYRAEKHNLKEVSVVLLAPKNNYAPVFQEPDYNAVLMCEEEFFRQVHPRAWLLLHDKPFVLWAGGCGNFPDDIEGFLDIMDDENQIA